MRRNVLNLSGWAMTNERLRSEAARAGMTITQLATAVEVDPKTVERWIQNGRVPHPRHRARAAEVLGTDETYLWPKLLDDERSRSKSQSEVLTVYPHRGAVPTDLWRRLIDDVSQHLDVLVYAGLFLVDTNPDLPKRISEKATDGLEARLLYGDPESDIVAARGDEEGIGSNLAARIHMSRTYLEEALGAPCVELRIHDTVLYNSIYRFDNEMLVNTHVHGFPAGQNPVLHLQCVPGGRLFDHYLHSFELVWASAEQPLA